MRPVRLPEPLLALAAGAAARAAARIDLPPAVPRRLHLQRRAGRRALPARPGDHPLLRLALPQGAGPAAAHGYDIVDHGGSTPRSARGRLRCLLAALHASRHGPGSRHGAQPHGRRHQRERLVERRAGERPGLPLRRLLRHRLAGLAPARSSRTRSCCPSWASPTATSSRPASSRLAFADGAFFVHYYDRRVPRGPAQLRQGPGRTGSTSWRTCLGPGRPRPRSSTRAS